MRARDVMRIVIAGLVPAISQRDAPCSLSGTRGTSPRVTIAGHWVAVTRMERSKIRGTLSGTIKLRLRYAPSGLRLPIVAAKNCLEKKTMVEFFRDESHLHTRALQAYQVLVGLAWNRQTITYGDLSKEQMEEYGGGGILNRVLGCIMGWCYENGLPPLTVLVVNDQTGVPGGGLTTVPNQDWPASQQDVFGFNWFSIFPPSLGELKEAGERAHTENLKKPNRKLY